jgi:signal transduction histidine kinase/CheY-like chemotaxis protein/predicted hydrocarbon binding protein
MSLRTVRVPEGIAPPFEAVEALVSRYFQLRRDDPEHGTIEVFGERYVLVRAASLSVEFFRLCEELYGPGREAEADEFARNILFDLAHAIGKSDAENFHAKMGLVDPLAKLSAGPIHFAHTGWAFVEILPESRPAPDESFFLSYEHPSSFEAEAWIRAGHRRDFPVCIMNAGYSSGWCEASFGVKLVSAELSCRARGDEVCHFVMGHPDRIGAIVAARAGAAHPSIPDFFSRKRMEDELRRARDELEARVAQRTSELRVQMQERERVERQLRQSHKLEAVGRLAGGIAHDFNNLMAVVLGNGSVLRARLAADDPNAQLVDDVIAAAQRAAGLTKQLLAFGRTQAQKRERIDLRDLVAETSRMLSPILGEEIELSLDMRDEPACIEADRTQIDQVIVNLALNARDAMPDGGTLVIAVDRVHVDQSRGQELQVESGPYVRLTVRDQGVGMDDETVQHIFDPFFTTKEAGGNGMGLSTVYGVVRQSGGGIAVQTTRGSGTTFEVFLPEAATGESRSAGAAVAPTIGGRETVLVIEDEAPLRRIVAVILEDHGYRVLVAETPEAAIETARSEQIDLVLTDVVMPRTSGPQLVARITELQPKARVLYMSGYAEERLLSRTSADVDWLAKPFGARELALRVRQILDR